MKKLMITAATAAMIGGAFADGQVYEMTMNVKTTEAKSGTVYVQEGCYSSQSYRKQTSLKIAGLFWGCNCSTIAETADLAQDKGVFFWNATKKAAFYDQEADEYIQPAFEWKLLNRIGQKACDVEGVWELTYGDAYLYGAGFGKANGYEDSAYVTSMCGNFAGTMNPGNACKRCEEVAADAWPLCECGEQDEDLTAAYGTWSLKFNSSAAKKFANSSDWSWYKFPGDVLEAIQAIIGGQEVKPVEDKVAANYAAAKVAYEAAKVATEAAEAEYNELNDAYNGNTTDAMQDAEDALTAYWKEIEVTGEIDWYDSTREQMEEILDDAGVSRDVKTNFVAKAKAYGEALEDQLTETIALADLEAAYAHGYTLSGVQVTAAMVKTQKQAVADATDDSADALKDLKKLIEREDYALDTKTQRKLTTLLNTFNEQAAKVGELKTAYNAAVLDRDEIKYDYVDENHKYSAKDMKAALDDAEEEMQACWTNYWCSKNSKGVVISEGGKAVDNLEQAETACLVAKGSKDCQ